MIPLADPSLLYLLIPTFVVAFFLAFGVGANDVANSFGTSVGSGVLTLRQACILATIFEILGATLIGYQVSDTVRKGVFDVTDYYGEERLLMIGYLAALVGGAIWNLVATFLKLPISGTHSIIGAVLGFHVVCKGFSGINYMKLSQIVLSWFVSPLASGLVSVLIFMVIHRCIINREKSLQRGLFALPFFYGFTVFVNAISIVANGPKELMLNDLPWYTSLGISVFLAIIVAVIIYFVLVPHHKAKILDVILPNASRLELRATSVANNAPNSLATANGLKSNSTKLPMTPNSTTGHTGSDSHFTPIMMPGELKPKALVYSPNEKVDVNGNGTTNQNVLLPPCASIEFINVTLNSADPEAAKSDNNHNNGDDKPEVAYLFKFLQILTACFGSFAHGGNDVSNAIGPLIGVFLIWRDGSVFQDSESPLWLMLFGGIGISAGLWIWGRKVIKTIGHDLTKIVPSTGFTIEIGAATTVLLASKIGLPISTTHCKVGSVIMVGRYHGSKEAVNWSLFKNVVLAWLLTVPISAVLSGISMYLLKLILL